MKVPAIPTHGPCPCNRRKPTARALSGLFLLLMLAGSETAIAGPPSSGLVSAVLDGDTIVLQSGEKVRYLGIDAPELGHNGNPDECYGREARKANDELVSSQRIQLEYDDTTTDRHGRLLAYVTLSDGRSVNGELIRGGFAHVFRSHEGFSRFSQLLVLQRQALFHKRGMWGACPVKPERSYIANQRSGVFHRSGCRYGKRIHARRSLHFETRWAALDQGFSPCRRCSP